MPKISNNSNLDSFVEEILEGGTGQAASQTVPMATLVRRGGGGWCPLPKEYRQIVSVKEQYALERVAMADGFAELRLMRRAAKASWDLLEALWPHLIEMDVLCGSGNNGGDGYYVAQLAARHGINTRLIQVSGAPKTEIATLGFAAALEAGATLVEREDFVNSLPSATEPSNQGNTDGQLDFAPLSPNWVSGGHQYLEYPWRKKRLIVDAVLGIGFDQTRTLSTELDDLFQAVNTADIPVLALDCPSGLDAESGSAQNAIVANTTITFIRANSGLMTGLGPAKCGDLYLSDLGIDFSRYSKPSSAEVIDVYHSLNLMEKVSASAHKGTLGKLAICGGAKGYLGAVVMASQSAIASGCGTVRLYCGNPDAIAALGESLPQVMVTELHSQDMTNWLHRDASDAFVVGPGLGRSAWSKSVLAQAIEHCRERSIPSVWDADALTLLAQLIKSEKEGLSLPPQSVITPHPLEAARLLGCTVTQVESNRIQAVRDLADKTQAVVVLKGSGTLIYGPSVYGSGAESEKNSKSIDSGSGPFVCSGGSPVLATGGSGDILAGVIGALLAKGLSPLRAAQLAVAIHSEAGDRCAALGGSLGLSAAEVIAEIRGCLYASGSPHSNMYHH